MMHHFKPLKTKHQKLTLVSLIFEVALNELWIATYQA